MAPRSGTTTSRSAESCTFWLSAARMLPTPMIGAATATVKASSASICTCWTSFVVRVMSDGVPK